MASYSQRFLSSNESIPPISMEAMYDDESLCCGCERNIIGDVVYQHPPVLYYEVCMINGCTWRIWQVIGCCPSLRRRRDQKLRCENDDKIKGGSTIHGRDK